MRPLRAVTLNLWGEQGPHERRLELVAAGLAALAPDVVALQEVREVAGRVPNQAATLAGRLGFFHCYAPATPWGGGDEGLGLLSRWPLDGVEARELPHAKPTERRIVLSAALATPAGAVRVYTTHLNYRHTDGLVREDQIVALDDVVRSHPSELPQLVMGDFNAGPDCDEIRFLRGKHTVAGRRAYYQDAWERRHGPEAPGLTWASRNPYTDPLRWLERDRRIDYVFVTPMRSDGRGAVLDCRVVLDEPAPDGVFPSDHFGVLAEVQLGPDATS